MQKVCTCCKQEKLIEFFPKNKSSKDGYYRLCKNCSNTEGKKYYVINKLELNKRRATYWKHYKQSHKTVRNNRDNERRKIDPGFRLTNNMRNRIRLALLNNVKCERTPGLLGCTYENLKSYLENKFVTGMNWKNYGKFGWHIDHIKPCASFDLTKSAEQKQCFHYTNLQPLWATDNLKKGAKCQQ